MARQAYLPMKSFRADTLALIEHAVEIIADYQAQGFVLTLRQIYYQFVQRNLIPNKQESYDKLGRIIADARNCGMIDWDAIEDRTRNMRGVQHWRDPAHIMGAVGNSYKLDKWAAQPFRLEVWIEKEALAGVFERICNALDVPFMACKGYMSQSEIRDSGVRIERYRGGSMQPTVVLHFGDHDPSGIDMTRDIGDRLSLYAEGPVVVKRLALNFDQVEQYNPPPNPAKVTDSRFQQYELEHGSESWELDALNPEILAGIVRDNVALYRHEEAWAESLAKEADERALLLVASERWEDTATLISKKFKGDVTERAEAELAEAREESTLTTDEDDDDE